MINNKFENYIIASDMDGTFLGYGCRVLENNIKAIKYFTDNGGKFALATGRCVNALKLIFPNVKEYTNTPSIVCGGAYLYDFENEKFISVKSIEYNKAFSLCNKIKELFPDIGVRISFEKGFVCPVVTEYLKSNVENTPNLIKSTDLEYLKDKTIHKIVYVAEKEKISKLKEFLKEYHFEGIQYTTSSDHIVEFYTEGASKGSILPELKLASGSERKLICVGDYDNDIDMLMNCDIPASPQNACDKVKSITKVHLCDNNQGCIADLIDKIENNLIK